MRLNRARSTALLAVYVVIAGAGIAAAPATFADEGAAPRIIKDTRGYTCTNHGYDRKSEVLIAGACEQRTVKHDPKLDHVTLQSEGKNKHIRIFVPKSRGTEDAYLCSTAAVDIPDSIVAQKCRFFPRM